MAKDIAGPVSPRTRSTSPSVTHPDAGRPATSPGSATKMERGVALRFVRPSSGGTPVARALDEGLSEPSQPLDVRERRSLERRVGFSFGDIRIHAGARAAASAAALGAEAYTVRRDIVFGAGRFAPQTSAGRRLLDHELAHVAQQRFIPGGGSVRLRRGSEGLEREAELFAMHGTAGRLADRRDEHLTAVPSGPLLQGAFFRIGPLTILVNYGNVTNALGGQVETAIRAYVDRWAGAAALTPARLAAIAALNQVQQQWVLFGIDLLNDNRAAAAGLARATALDRLLARAPASATSPRSPDFGFETEVLRVSGWLEVALASRLSPPTGQTLADIGQIYNPPATAATVSQPTLGTWDPVRFATLLEPLLRAWVRGFDPALHPLAGTHSIATLQTIGDEILDEARTFFAPYADAAMRNPISAGWRYSANLTSTQATVVTTAMRLAFLRNRANTVAGLSRSALQARLSSLGVSPIPTLPQNSVFEDVNFSGADPAHRAALEQLVTTLEADPVIQPIVDRLLRNTGRTSRAGGDVAVSIQYDDVALSECAARWKVIQTLCHELCHVLAHPSFSSRASAVQQGQVIGEGFTEVLGVQLHTRLRQRAAADAAFRGRMEAGLSGACPAPTPSSIGYGAAGAGAEQIRQRVGDGNFRAAYFLGAVNLVGL